MMGGPPPFDTIGRPLLREWLDQPELLDAAIQRTNGEAERAGRLLLVIPEPIERALDLVAGAEGERPLQEILELANVAGEVVRGHRGQRVGGDALDLAAEALV